MSMFMSLVVVKTSEPPGCPFPGLLGHGISPTPMSIQNNTVMMSEHRPEFEPQTARQIIFTVEFSLNGAALWSAYVSA